MDISRFCKYDLIWMSIVDFIELGSYTYLVPEHREMVRTRRRATPLDQCRGVGTKGLGISVFVIN